MHLIFPESGVPRSKSEPDADVDMAVHEPPLLFASQSRRSIVMPPRSPQLRCDLTPHINLFPSRWNHCRRLVAAPLPHAQARKGAEAPPPILVFSGALEVAEEGTRIGMLKIPVPADTGR